MDMSQRSYKTTVNVRPIPGSPGYLIPDADYCMEITCKVIGINIRDARHSAYFPTSTDDKRQVMRPQAVNRPR
jgi:hypothetical protein